MKFTPSFTVLLNTVLVAVSIAGDVQAVPTGRHDAALSVRELSDTAVEHIDSPVISNITARAPDPRVVSIPLQAFQLGQRDVGYVGAFRLGAQAQIVPMLIDSGSSTFWVIPKKDQQKGFDFSGSKDLERTWEIEYGDGDKASGPVVEDSVKVGSLDAMANFPIGVGTTLSDRLTSIPARGTAGFTNGKLETTTRTGGVTLVEGLKASGLIPASIVGIQLGRGANLGTAGTGQLTVGGSNPAKFESGVRNSVTARNTAQGGLWQLTVENSKVSGRLVRTSRGALIDTGNSRILTTKGDAQLFHTFPGAFESGGIFGVPCDPTKIPPISFTVGSVEFPINPVDIIGAEIVAEGVPKGQMCYSLIQDHDDKPGKPPRTTWSLGIPFLKNVYLILDSDANKITLAKPA
ncbi:hypothetical protein EWM64_g8415 [Hericium alpestre]|uniref:Peptidase A1 domain-containing protein n=1 Tax=Hericium alpestre TaxID=135208 RepID=A0A4Y9ZNH6_9AGAM|nr:hypothetical protein EWM64_g8415 [Hericium alpestre]